MSSVLTVSVREMKFTMEFIIHSQVILIILYHLSFPLVLHSWMMNRHVKVLVASFKVPYHHFILCTEITNENHQEGRWSPGKNSNLRIYRAWKNSTTKLPEVMGRTKTKIYCPASICLTHLCNASPSKWVWLRFKIKQNQWCILKKVVILTNFKQML